MDKNTIVQVPAGLDKFPSDRLEPVHLILFDNVEQLETLVHAQGHLGQVLHLQVLREQQL